MPDIQPELQTHLLISEAQPKPGLLTSHSRLMRWLNLCLDLLYPPRCAGCQRVDTYWCARCQQDTEAIPLLLTTQARSPLRSIASTAIHDGLLQQAIWSLKYENCPPLADPLSHRLAARLLALDWTFDILVPVPLHTSRLRERGYNQSQLLAAHLAQQVSQPCLPTAVHRQRQTTAQVGLSALERQTNMQDAFIANPQLVSGKTLLLIDDVFTTGATLAACAQAALDAGAVAVYGLTLTTARNFNS